MAWNPSASQTNFPPSNHLLGYASTLEAEHLLHELAGHVEKATNTASRAAGGTTATASLQVHLERHLSCRADDVLLGRAAGSVAVGILLVCDIVSCVRVLA